MSCASPWLPEPLQPSVHERMRGNSLPTPKPISQCTYSWLLLGHVQLSPRSIRLNITLFAPLFPELLPPIQSLPDLPLEAAIHRLVEFLPSQLFRPVILTGKGVRLVMVVSIALA